jgi:hypothetical protein
MMSEDKYLDHTPDLVARVRKMREAAEKMMNKFTHVADYDVRRAVGRKPKQKPHPAIQLVLPTDSSVRGSAPVSDAGQSATGIPATDAGHPSSVEGA